jgi:ribosomal protein S18 acetylase RimI-like enzyme
MNDERQASISPVTAAEFSGHLPGLAALLHACVHAGANINFVLPFSEAEAEGFWTARVLPALETGTRILWIARQDGRIAGSVQLDTDTPPNQPHRAEVAKLLVHPDFRRRGLAKMLMAELERHASRLGRTLITLDTRTGDKAEPLYASIGYATAGIIPDFCRDPIEDRLHPTTIMYKKLADARHCRGRPE